MAEACRSAPSASVQYRVITVPCQSAETASAAGQRASSIIPAVSQAIILFQMPEFVFISLTSLKCNSSAGFYCTFPAPHCQIRQDFSPRSSNKRIRFFRKAVFFG